jgi:UrcA family protein
MRIQMLRAGALLISCAFIGSVMAQTTTDTAEIVVTSSRMIEKTTLTAGRITQVTLSYTVSAKGLDLTSQDGKAKFEKAVSDAAYRVCQELTRQFPDGRSQQEKCEKQAKSDAMPKVHELEANAGKGATGK